jgi:hypothetical protein
MNLAKQVGDAVDRVFADEPGLRGFTKHDTKSGDSFRRYYMATAYAEREIQVYRDKYWTKDGGKVYIELYCLIPEVQQLLGGVEQSWLNPDYSKPIICFQYRTSVDADETLWEICTPGDIAAFEMELRRWLTSEGLPWLNRLDSREGLLGYLARDGDHIYLARLLAHWGRREAAMRHMTAFLNALPRQIERPLQSLTDAGLLTTDDQALLLKASIQNDEEYRRRVQTWLKEK